MVLFSHKHTARQLGSRHLAEISRLPGWISTRYCRLQKSALHRQRNLHLEDPKAPMT